ICLFGNWNFMNSYTKDIKNSNLIYKGNTSMNYASDVSVKLVSFFNKLKKTREKKDLEFFYINVNQQTKNKLLKKTIIAIYKSDPKLEESDITYIDHVKDDNPNTNSLHLLYDLIKRSIVSKEQYKDKNIIIISNNLALSNMERNEKLTEFTHIEDADLLKEIYNLMKNNNNTIDGLTSHREVSHIIDKS
ncbi:3551_t:CDS:2, partial [Dentiscutata heterogama]